MQTEKIIITKTPAGNFDLECYRNGRLWMHVVTDAPRLAKEIESQFGGCIHAKTYLESTFKKVNVFICETCGQRIYREAQSGKEIVSLAQLINVS
jgi:hypothetical protein